MSFFEKLDSLLEEPDEAGQLAFKKKASHSTGEGDRYEEAVLALALLRSLRAGLRFALSANDDDAGAFDDLVLRWKNRDSGGGSAALLVQLKHKTSARQTSIRRDSLMVRKDSKKGSKDFSIELYYESYKKIRESIEGGSYTLVLSTNLDLDTDAHDMFVPGNPKSVPGMELLDSGGRLYSLNPDDDYIKCLVPGDDPFIQHFYLFCNQSSNKSIRRMIYNELKLTLGADDSCCKRMSDDLCGSIREWMNSENTFLTSSWRSWLNIVHTYIRDKVTTCNSTITKKIKYSNVEPLQAYIQDRSPAWIRPPGRGAAVLTATKLHQILRDEAHIVISVARLTQLQEKVQCCWGPFCRWLVLVDDTEESCDILRRMVELAGPERRLLIVSQKGDDFCEDKCNSRDIPDDTWKELTNVEIRLNSDQYSCRLGDLCDTEALKTILDENPEALAALSQLTGPVRMGQDLEPLPNNHIDRRLISRMHVREEFFSKLGDYDMCIMDKLSYNHFINVSINKTVKFEELENYLRASNAVWPLFSVTEIIDLHVIQMICSKFQNMCVYVLCYEEDGWKILFLHRGSAKILPYVKEQSRSLWQIVDSFSSRIIVDGKPGIGKSTFLLDIANQVKRKNPSWWILRINLLTYSEVFNSSSTSFEAVNDILLRVVYSEKNVGILEHLLLQHCLVEYDHIICLVDGFDEICPDYAEKCLQALQQLAPRRGKLVVATRPSVTDRLEAAMGVLAHSLPAFTVEEVHRFHQEGNSMLGVTGVVVELLNIPLFSRMYAEALDSGIVDDIVSLYKTFLKENSGDYMKRSGVTIYPNLGR